MDFYTKLFLLNMVTLGFTAFIDRNVFDDAIEDMPILGVVLQYWAFLSLLTIPVWLFYIILTD